MHYASKTASASRGVPAIRLTLRNPSRFSVPAQFLVLMQNPAGGGSQPFNRFLAELTARADLFAAKAAHGLVGDGGVYRSESTFKLDKPQGWATRSYGSG